MNYRIPRQGDIAIVSWNLSGVVIPDRATTYLAMGTSDSSKPFKNRIFSECGVEGPMKDIDRSTFIYFLRTWQEDNGKDTESRGNFGAAVTDLRHKYPQSGITLKQTKYIKNMLLEGISMAEVNRIMGNRNIVPLNPSFEKAVERLRKEGIRQVIFSNTTHPVVEFFKETYGMEHAEGLPVIVRVGSEELLYTPEMYGSPDVFFTGKLEREEWDKFEAFLNYIQSEKIHLENVAAINEDDSLMFEVMQNGGLAVGYKVAPKYREEFVTKGIPILKRDNLEDFAEVVLDPGKLAIYCEMFK